MDSINKVVDASNEIEGIEALYQEKEVDVIPEFGACGGGDEEAANQIQSNQPPKQIVNAPRLTDSDIK